MNLSALSPTAETAIGGRKLRAPRGDEESLFVPALSHVPALFARNQSSLGQRSLDAKVQFLDQPLSQLRAAARFSLLESASDYTRSYRDVDLPWRAFESGVLLAGHQPELFHPGVWLKNFVLGQLGKSLQAIPINLVVDNDVAAHTSVRVPVGTGENLHYEEVSIDEPGPNVAFEERRVISPETVRDFPERLRKILDPGRRYRTGHSSPLLAEALWKYIELPQSGDSTLPLGELLARARHRLEQDFGLHTLELPLSQVVQSPPFQAFATQLWLDLPRLREIYNEALSDYRHVNKIRSKNHPVPELAADGDWLEAPFWIWTKENPQRKHLFIRQQRSVDGRITLELSDRDRIHVKLTGSVDNPAAWLDQTVMLDRQVRIRPRALITTMFSRLIASDLFIHGIGGAKYDELTDEIIRRYWNIEPPEYLTVTGTVRLPIQRPGVTSDDLTRERQTLRNFLYRPEEFVDEAASEVRPQLRQLATKWRQLLSGRNYDFRRVSPETHAQLDELRIAMSNLLGSAREAHAQNLARLEESFRQAKLLGSREFSFVLFPADKLPAQLHQMATQVAQR